MTGRRNKIKKEITGTRPKSPGITDITCGWQPGPRTMQWEKLWKQILEDTFPLLSDKTSHHPDD